MSLFFTLTQHAKRWISQSCSHCLPSTCLLCGGDAVNVLCNACKLAYFSQTIRRCPCCARPYQHAIASTSPVPCCGICLKNPPGFDATFVVCDYIPPIDQLILALKFGRRLSIASAIAELMVQATISTDELVDAAHLPDLLISVPLSQQRLSERGFNQSLEIAKPLAQALLHPSQRRHNLHKAFTLNAGYTDKIAGQHIGVVDDVITTGATLHEIAVYLKRQGAAKITNLVFARTPPH